MEVIIIQLIDLTGKMFGRLKVIRRIDDLVDSKTGRRYVRWECECTCDDKTIINVIGDNLRSGKVKSCGCLRVDNLRRIRKENSKDNIYDLAGEYGIGWTTNTGQEFYFDLEDYDKIKDYHWYDNGDYVTCSPDGKKTIFMQNLIMNPIANERVDHIKHNTYDNRKKYLRIGTIADNNANRVKLKNNTSGVTGVSFHKGTQKWQAYISRNGKRKYLGLFSDFNDAVEVRKKAENKYFKEWSYANSMNKDNEGEK